MSPRRTPLDIAAWMLVAAGIAWLLFRMTYFAGWMDDDAFISFRYARHAADGHGLVYNTGERVEGYTNFLWTLLLSAAHRLGADIPRTAQILGAASAVAGVLVLARLVRPSPLWFLPVLVVCGNESWAAWAVGGLENVPSALLVLLAFAAYRRWLLALPADTESRTQRTSDQLATRWQLMPVATALGLAAMNHPTNLVFTAVIGADALRQRRGSGRELGLAALVFMLLYGSFTAWRILYYGDVLPNTFHAKGGFAWAVLARGIEYFGSILRSFPLPYMGLAILAFQVARRHARDPIHPALVAAIAAHSAAIVWFGGEAFPAYRSMVVLVPLFAWMIHDVTRTLIAAWHTDGAPAGRRGLALAAAGLLLVFATNAPLWTSERVRRLDGAIARDLTGRSRAAARMLRDVLPSDCLFAYSAAGVLAYDTGFRWIDTLGLTDRHIARTPVPDLGRGKAGHEKGDGAYVLSRQPDYVLFTMWDLRPGTKSDRELARLPEFKAEYRPVRYTFRYRTRIDPAEQEQALYVFARQATREPSLPK
jgi:hypothetical protein